MTFSIKALVWNRLSFIHGLILAIIIIVVAVKEIYDENRGMRGAECTGQPDPIFMQNNGSNFSPRFSEFGYCYMYTVVPPAYAKSADCIIPVGVISANTLVEFRQTAAVHLSTLGINKAFRVDNEMELNVEVDFTNYFQNYNDQAQDLSEVPYGGFEIWTNAKISEQAPEVPPPSLADSVNMMKYILGGLCGGLLALILIMFLFTRFVYPRFNGGAVNQNPANQTIHASDHGRNLPGLCDLPPGYDNIEEYAKVDNETAPPPYMMPPAYSEINELKVEAKPEAKPEVRVE